MACLGYVLSVLPVNEIMEYLDVLLTPHIEQLQQIGTMEVSTNDTSDYYTMYLSNSWLNKQNTFRPRKSHNVFLVLNGAC